MKNIKWGGFRLDELFDIKPTKYYRLTNDEILSEKGITPLVSNASVDNGVMGFSNLPPLNKGNSISCSDTTLGAETMYYQKNDYIGYQHIQSFIPKLASFNSAIAFFIISASHTATSNGQFNYGHKFNRESMRKILVFLPVNDNGSIDFDFMESFIAELEAERVAELSAYLKVSGLDNYALSSDEVQALQDYNSLSWKKFNLKELYGKATRGKRLKGADRVPGTLPFVTAGEASTGISAYIGNKVEVFSPNTTTIDMFGSAKYRNYKYGADDHVAVVHTEKVPMKSAIFLTAAIHKAAHTGKFDYGHNFYAKDADDLDVALPVKDNMPDYTAMGNIISAIQKLVIKDVAKYADDKVKATKSIIRNS